MQMFSLSPQHCTSSPSSMLRKPFLSVLVVFNYTIVCSAALPLQLINKGCSTEALSYNENTNGTLAPCNSTLRGDCFCPDDLRICTNSQNTCLSDEECVNTSRNETTSYCLPCPVIKKVPDFSDDNRCSNSNPRHATHIMDPRRANSSYTLERCDSLGTVACKAPNPIKK